MEASAPGPAFENRHAAALRGFGPVGLFAVLVILGASVLSTLLAAILVLAWARESRTPWRDLGYAAPRSWIGSALGGIAFGVALKLVMKAVVMPLLGAPPINPAYHHLVGDAAAAAGMVASVVLNAGFGEETFYRGYLFERLGRLLGRGVGARIAIVLLTSAWFGAVHYADQGLPGVQQALIVGLVWGATFAVTGRLWMLMWAHAFFDITAVAIIYWDLETRVAQLFFR